MNATAESIAVQNVLAKRIRRAVKHATTTLGFVPVDKLDFKPSETANSCRDLAKHIVQGNCIVLKMVGGDSSASPEVSEIVEIVAAIEMSGEDLAQLAEKATDEALDVTVDFFGHPSTVLDALLAAEWHMSRHTGQIDYVETIWGDTEDHS